MFRKLWQIKVLKIVTLCGWGTRRGSQIYIIFTTDLVLAKMFVCVKFEESWMLISLSLSVLFFKILNPMWGRYQKKWSDLYHLYNRSCVDGNIEMCQVWMESDVNFAFYELHGYSKFWPFVGEVPEGVDRYIPSSQQILC